MGCFQFLFKFADIYNSGSHQPSLGDVQRQLPSPKQIQAKCRDKYSIHGADGLNKLLEHGIIQKNAVFLPVSIPGGDCSWLHHSFSMDFVLEKGCKPPPS